MFEFTPHHCIVFLVLLQYFTIHRPPSPDDFQEIGELLTFHTQSGVSQLEVPVDNDW